MRRGIEDPPGGLSIRTPLRVNMADKEARGVKYILLIYGDEREWTSMSQEELAKVYEQHGAYGDAMVKAGVMRGGYELQPVATATSLRFTNGKPKTSDGPFAETKEQLGGYYIIEVDTLDQAIEWAEKMPAMSSGTVEIRPLGMGS
jgi:hypothetical protein